MTTNPDPAAPPVPSLPDAMAPPSVDDLRVAAALAEVADLQQQPLAEHHDRLARAHEVLHQVLHGDPTTG